MTVQPNARMPVAHYHESWDETIYGLAGASTWRVDGRDIVLKPGQSIFIKRGIVHAFRNDTQRGRELAVHSHPGRARTGLFSRDCGLLSQGAPDRAKNEGDHAPLRARARPTIKDFTCPRDVRRRSKCPCRPGQTGSAPSGGPSDVRARARLFLPGHARARARV